MSKERELKDKKVQELFDVVQAKKAAIAKAEKPNWKTNCVFKFDTDSNKIVNLHTVSDTALLVGAYEFLLNKQGLRKQAAEDLGVEDTFEWMGFTVEDWKDDFKTRITKINLVNEKAKLDLLEKKLSALVSPEMKAAMELAEIEKLLS